MPELWKLCTHRGLAVLIQLYWDESGHYPDFYYELSGERKRPLITMSPEVEQEMHEVTNRFMSLPPQIDGRGY